VALHVEDLWYYEPAQRRSSSGLEKFGSGLACHCWFCGSIATDHGTAEPANDNWKRFSAKPY
jgi:hypothetical protein